MAKDKEKTYIAIGLLAAGGLGLYFLTRKRSGVALATPAEVEVIKEAYKKIKQQINEGTLLKVIEKIKLEDGTKTGNTFNGLINLEVEEDYVEEGD